MKLIVENVSARSVCADKDCGRTPEYAVNIEHGATRGGAPNLVSMSPNNLKPLIGDKEKNCRVNEIMKSSETHLPWRHH